MKLTIETTSSGFALKLFVFGRIKKALYSQNWGKIVATSNRWQQAINQTIQAN